MFRRYEIIPGWSGRRVRAAQNAAGVAKCVRILQRESETAPAVKSDYRLNSGQNACEKIRMLWHGSCVSSQAVGRRPDTPHQDSKWGLRPYSGCAVALPLTRMPLAGRSCRV